MSGVYTNKVFLCSPYSNEFQLPDTGFAAIAKLFSLHALREGCIPIAPHIFYPPILNNNSDKDKRLGIECGLALLPECAEMWVLIDFGISAGMTTEIEAALKTKGTKKSIPISAWRLTYDVEAGELSFVRDLGVEVENLLGTTS